MASTSKAATKKHFEELNDQSSNESDDSQLSSYENHENQKKKEGAVRHAMLFGRGDATTTEEEVTGGSTTDGDDDPYERSWDFCPLSPDHLGRPADVGKMRTITSESQRDGIEEATASNEEKLYTFLQTAKEVKKFIIKRNIPKECSFWRFRKVCQDEEWFTTYTVEILTEAETHLLIDAWECNSEEQFSSSQAWRPLALRARLLLQQ